MLLLRFCKVFEAPIINGIISVYILAKANCALLSVKELIVTIIILIWSSLSGH